MMRSVSRLYLDTNILIELNEGEGSQRPHLEQLLAQGARSGMSFVTSALTVSELLVKPYRDGKLDLARTYYALSQGLEWLSIVPVSDEVMDLAALVRARYSKLKLPGAIHLASAGRHRCEAFLGADQGIGDLMIADHPLFGTRPPISVTVMRPDEPTLKSLLESLSS